MAELLGLVASGLSIASLAIQIIENLNRVSRFCDSIRESPTHIRQITSDLRMLSSVVLDIQIAYEKHSLSKSAEARTKECLESINHEIKELSNMILNLERKLTSHQRLNRSWGRVKTVLSEKKIEALRCHLDRAIRTLQLLQTSQIWEQVLALNSVSSQTPKTLGYPWESSQIKDCVKIDDGLESIFALPLDLCSSLADFLSFLSWKYSHYKLPGLKQIKNGHIAILDWSGINNITAENWSTVVKGGHGIKLAFLMSISHGVSKSKCMRCFKPSLKTSASGRYKKCDSCGLEVLRVEPDAIPFETADVIIGGDRDCLRDYKISKQKEKLIGQGSSINRDQSQRKTSTPRTPWYHPDNPPVDLVCRRLIIKWEPIYNIVHRYTYCRCVLRRSTPSYIEEEMTLLLLVHCPRHNRKDISFKDYGDIDYDRDPYFAQFGGYRAFQGFIYHFAPKHYEYLGGEKFLPTEQIGEALSCLDEFWKGDDNGLPKLYDDYAFEVNDRLERRGVKLDGYTLDTLQKERTRRKTEASIRNQQRGYGRLTGDVSQDFSREWSESPMMQEVYEILEGKWSGITHWSIDD